MKSRPPQPAPVDPELLATYAGALRWLYSHVDLERSHRIREPEKAFRLDRTRAILHQLGDPHDHLHAVHVAGTKGKGSTVAMLAAALSACERTVGQFTSPHLIDVRERIRVGRSDISEADFHRALVEVALAAKAAGVEQLHFFEILTAAGLFHFARQAVDVAILEVGLGGRLDATNVITPDVCAVAQISFDHMDVLGDTLAKIAREKAGIFKPGVPVIAAPQAEEVEAVLREEAERASAPIRFLENELAFTSRFETTPRHGPHYRVCLETPRTVFDHVQVPLRGEHQAINCGVVLGVVDALRERGEALAEDAVVEGLSETVLHGRFEQVCAHPRIIIDGAHNAASVAALMRTLPVYLRYDSLVVVFGCGRDKDIAGMLRALAMAADKIIFTRTRHNPRACDPGSLDEMFEAYGGKMTQTADTLAEAVELARRAVGREDIICITGSFYLAGEARQMFLERPKSAAAPAGRAYPDAGPGSRG